MALSSSSRRTFAFNALISAFSADLTPGRSPGSISASSTHRRTVSLPSRSRRATASAAAVSDEYSPRCSRTRRTARSLTARSIFFGMTPPSKNHKEAAGKPYRFSQKIFDSILSRLDTEAL
jgi:hypothetical protein